jgi:hypothetical protein
MIERKAGRKTGPSIHNIIMVPKKLASFVVG